MHQYSKVRDSTHQLVLLQVKSAQNHCCVNLNGDIRPSTILGSIIGHIYYEPFPTDAGAHSDYKQ